MLGFLVAAVAIALIAAVVDIRTGEIPQWLTLGGIGAGATAHLVYAIVRDQPSPLGEFGFSFLSALGCAVVPLILYRQDAIGGGDVKLLAALGAILHWPGMRTLGFEAEVYSFFAAGLLAPARLAYEGKLFRTLKNTALLAINPLLPKKRRRKVEPTLLTWFRFGPAIFIGTALVAYTYWRP
jgi:prepilin peptidase CpaA